MWIPAFKNPGYCGFPVQQAMTGAAENAQILQPVAAAGRARNEVMDF